jgi:hypothetical protein
MWHGVATEPGARGAPLLVGALGWLECAVRDEVDPLLVESLPELPPRGRAAVAEVEVDGRRDGEEAGLRHERSV